MPDNDNLTLPNDIKTEQWLLGGLMRSRQALTEVVELLEPADFYRPQHQVIYLAVVRLFAQGIEVDPVTLRAELESGGDGQQAWGVRGPVYLADLFGDAVSATTGGTIRHAEIVREKSVRRQVIVTLEQAVQRARMLDIGAEDVVAEGAAAMFRIQKTAGELRARGMATSDSAAFTATRGERRPAVIPGLLDYADRVVLVGAEGSGKTTMGLQLALCSAAGVHPFTFTPVPAIRVLIIDLENPRELLRRKIKGLMAVAERSEAWNPANLRIMSQPGGIDLTSPSGRLRLSQAIHEASPDLVVAGPVYKMLVDRGQGAEELHSQVAFFWDEIRERFGPALWLETHAPGSAAGGERVLRPIGSSLWMRWPEFGLALGRALKDGSHKLGRFRGDREEGRLWPESLSRNRAPSPCWPWAARYPDGTFQSRMDEGPGW